jgi:hypothetical protein
MLRRLSFSLFCAFFALSLSACDSGGSDGDGGGSGGMGGSAAIEATIDGSDFAATLVATADHNDDGSIDVVGSDQTRTIGLTIEAAATGTYTASNGGTVASMIVSASGEAFSTVLGGSGTIRVTSISADRVAGTFSFTATSTLSNTVSVTNGTFDVAFVDS